MDITDCSRLSGLRILSRKWSYLVLRTLRTPHVFSDIKREFRVITNRTLSQELKHLETEGLLEHRNDVYSLSPAGKALVEAAEPLHKWSVTHKKLTPCPPELSCGRCVHYNELIQLSRTH